MITRDQLKNEIDRVDESSIEVLHKIILALANPRKSDSAAGLSADQTNPLKGTVVFEKDIVSPLDDAWSVGR